MKTNKKMQNAKQNKEYAKMQNKFKKTKQYKTNYKQIQYKILKIEKRSKRSKNKK